jgi:hypothetical protein
MSLLSIRNGLGRWGISVPMLHPTSLRLNLPFALEREIFALVVVSVTTAEFFGS